MTLSKALLPLKGRELDFSALCLVTLDIGARWELTADPLVK